MNFLYPERVSLNLNRGTFQLEKSSLYPNATFVKQSSSSNAVATVSESGLVTLKGVGQFNVDLVDNGKVLATSEISVKENTTTDLPSHIKIYNNGIGPLLDNVINLNNSISFFPIIFFSNGAESQGNSFDYSLEFSTDAGKNFYSLASHPTLTEYITLNSVIDNNLFGYQISCKTGLADDLILKLTYTKSNTSYTQKFYFTLNGPNRVSYTPFYSSNGFELDVGSYLDFTAIAYDTHGNTLATTGVALNPDVLSIDEFNRVTALRATDIDLTKTYANSKDNVWSYTKAKTDTYVSAKNIIYKFDDTSGYTAEFIKYTASTINLRSVSTAHNDTELLTYISIADIQPTIILPKTVVYKSTISQVNANTSSNIDIDNPVAHIDEVGTAFTVVNYVDGYGAPQDYCILATRTLPLGSALTYANLDELGYTRLLLFPANSYNVDLKNPSPTNIVIEITTLDSFIIKFIAGPTNWVFMLTNSGSVYACNLKTGALSQLLYANAAAISISESNKEVLWAYQNTPSGPNLVKYKLAYDGNYVSYTTQDYGSIATQEGFPYILRADVIGDVHHIVFGKAPRLESDIADCVPLVNPPQSPVGVVNCYIGLLDTSKQVEASIQFRSVDTPTISSTAKFAVHPSNTKKPYFLKSSLNEFNFPTEFYNLIPVQAGYSDTTFDYNILVTGTNVTPIQSGSVFYVKSDDETPNVKLLIKTADSKVGKEFSTFFYRQPVRVHLGDTKNPNSLQYVPVKIGSTVSVPTSIFVNNKGSESLDTTRKLLVSGNNTSIANFKQEGNSLIIPGVAVGSTRFYYQTPQPLSYPITGYFDVSVTGVAVPARIDITNTYSSHIYVGYRPTILANSFKSFETLLTGQVVYSDESRPKLPNVGLSWSVDSGPSSDYFAVSNNTFTVKSAITSNPSYIGTGTVSYTDSVTQTLVQRSFYLHGYVAEEDTTPVDYLFPSYVTDYGNKVNFEDIPNKRIDFQIRLANNTFVYGNNRSKFTVASDSNLSVDSLGNLSLKDTTKAGSYDLTITGTGLNTTHTITIAVKGPDSIVSLLPYYYVDAGSTLPYVTGLVYDLDGKLLPATLKAEPSSAFTLGLDNLKTSGILRGHITEHTKVNNPILQAVTTEENTLAYLDVLGNMYYLDDSKDIVAAHTHTDTGDSKATVFDFYRRNIGIAGVPFQTDTILYRKNITANFSKWGPISGTITSLCAIDNLVYFTRTRNSTKELGVLGRATPSPINGNYLDYAIKLIPEVTGPVGLARDGSKVVCRTEDGKGFVIYDRQDEDNTIYQVFSGSSLASASHSLTTSNLVFSSDVDATGNQLCFGKVATGLTGISAGPVFYFNSGTTVFKYEPYSAAIEYIKFTPKDYSATTFTNTPVQVLPSGTAKDYYITASLANPDDVYISLAGELYERDLTVKVYNSNRSVSTSGVVYLNGQLYTESKVKFTRGGINQITVTSQLDPNVSTNIYVDVKRRVKRIFVKNFLVENGNTKVIAVNAESSVPLEAYVEYEDGYIDTQLDAIITATQNISTEFRNNQLYLNGLSVTTTPVDLKLKAKTPKGTNLEATFKVSVYPPGTKKLSTLYLPEKVQITEQSVADAGALLIYTNGVSESLYNEGFQEDLSGLRSLGDIKDLTIDDSDTLYVLTSGNLYTFNTLGTLLNKYNLPSTSNTGHSYTKVRVSKGIIYLSDTIQVFKASVNLDGFSLEATSHYGSPASGEPTSIVKDFQFDAGDNLYTLEISSSSGVIKSGGLSSLAPSVVSFVVSKDGQTIYTLDSTGVILKNGAPFTSVTNAKQLFLYNDELYVSSEHRISRVLSNGSISYIAGSLFSGLNNGSGVDSRFSSPTSIVLDSRRRIFVLDSGNKTLRKIENGRSSALVGGFWASSAPKVAVGLGPQILASYPGTAELTVEYLGVTGTVSAIVPPTYTSISITGSSFTAIKSNSQYTSDKATLNFGVSLYSYSGFVPVGGDQISITDINGTVFKYPPDINWGGQHPEYFTKDSTSKVQITNGLVSYTPTKVGRSFITAQVVGTALESAASIDCIELIATGIAFDKAAYFTKKSVPLSFDTQAQLVFNDGARKSGPYSVTYKTGSLTIIQLSSNTELETEVTATVDTFTATVPAYVYDPDITLVFNTGSISLTSGVTRDIAAKHVLKDSNNNITASIFQNKLITYTLSDSIKDHATISDNGLLYAKDAPYDGNVTAFSTLVEAKDAQSAPPPQNSDNYKKTKPISLVSATVFSNFEAFGKPYHVVHTGNTASYLGDIVIKVAPSSQEEPSVMILTSDNFTITPLNTNKKKGEYVDLQAINSDNKYPLLYIKDGLSTGTYTHGLNAVPYLTGTQPATFEVPILTVSPIGVFLTQYDDYVPEVSVCGGSTVKVKIDLGYNNDYFDINYKDVSAVVDPPNSTAGFSISEVQGQSGLYEIKGEVFDPTDTDTGKEQNGSLKYLYDQNVTFKFPIKITKNPVASKVEVVETKDTVIVTSLMDLTTLTARIYLNDNTLDTEKYSWYRQARSGEGSTINLNAKELNLIENQHLQDGDIIYAQESTNTVATPVTSTKIVFYSSETAITNPDHLNYLAQKGLLRVKRSVAFTPTFPSNQVQLDLDATLTSVNASSYVNDTLDNTNSPTLRVEGDYMLELVGNNPKAVFARKVQPIVSGVTGFIVGDESFYVKTVTQGSSTSIKDQNGNSIISDGVGTSHKIVKLKDGLIFTNADKLYATSTLTTSSNNIANLAYYRDNEFFAYTTDRIIKKFIVNYSAKSFSITNYAIGLESNQNFNQLLITPGGLVRYLTTTGIAINANGSLESIYEGIFDHAAAISENEYFVVSSSNRLEYLNIATEAKYKLGTLYSSLGNFTHLQRLDSEYVYAVTSNGYALKISVNDNMTKLTAVHPLRPSITSSLDFKILAPAENRDYVVAFDAKDMVGKFLAIPVGIKQKEAFKLKAQTVSTAGSATSATISHTSEVLKIDPATTDISGYTTLTGVGYGQVFVTGATTTLTGVTTVTVSPIVTGLQIFSDFVSDPKYFCLNVGSFLPFQVRGVLTDGSFDDNISMSSNAYVTYTGSYLYVSSLPQPATQSLTFTAVNSPSATLTTSLTILAAEDVRVVNFIIPPSPVSLFVDDRYFIDAKVYYSNGTTDQFIRTSVAASTAYTVKLYDSSMVQALKASSSTDISVKPATSVTYPTSLNTDKTLSLQIQAKFGVVELLRSANGSNPTGIKILSTTSDGSYLVFTEANLPILTTDSTKLLIAKTKVNAKDYTIADIIIEPAFTPVNINVPVTVSLPSAQNLTGETSFNYAVSDVKPASIRIDPAERTALRGVGYEFRVYAQYGDDYTTKTYKQEIDITKDLIASSFSVDKKLDSTSALTFTQDRTTKLWTYSVIEGFPSYGDDDKPNTITLNVVYSSLTGTATVIPTDAIPDSLNLFKKNISTDNPPITGTLTISSAIPISIYGALTDKNAPVKLEGPVSSTGLTVLSDATIVPAGQGLALGNDGTFFNPFTIQGPGTYVTTKVTYNNKEYTNTTQLQYLNTLVTDIFLETLSSPPVSFFTDKEAMFRVSVGSRAYVYPTFKNQNYLDKDDISTTYGPPDLFDFYLDGVIISGVSLKGLTDRDPTWLVSFSPQYGKDTEQLFYLALKGTTLYSNKVPIIIQDRPEYLNVTPATAGTLLSDRYFTVTGNIVDLS